MQRETNSGRPGRPRVRPAALASIVVIGAAVALSEPGAALTATPSAVDVVTYHDDNARTGQNLNETILTPANVNVATFGKVGFFPVDGKVDAQPLLLSGVTIPGLGVHDVLYVATEHDTVYGFDAVTGAVLWSRSLLGNGETTSEAVFGCGQVVPEIGITATPVISRSTGPNGIIYVVAMSKLGASMYIHRLHALDVTTGAEMFGGPMTVTATGFNPKQYEERSALLLLSGMVVLSWTSHCDDTPYNGWIMSYSSTTLAQISTLNTTPHGSGGAYWMAGAGPAADAASNVYLLAGNGTFDTALDSSGFPNQRDFGNAFLKLSSSPVLAVADYFATFDTVTKSAEDSDLGSGGTLLLPDLLDVNSQVRHLAVGAGKDGHIYLADRDSMGKFHSSPNDNSNLYQDVPGVLPGGVWSMPAYFNGTMYYGPVGSALRAFAIVNARIVSTPTSTTSSSFQYPGTTPGVSASGTSNAIVWAVENSSPAVLHAYDAQNLAHELYNSSQAAGSRDAFGPGNKFITPTIVNGRVYVGTPNGVAAFGLLAPTTVTGAASAIGKAGAMLAGTANPNGSLTIAFFEYGTTTSYGSATPAQMLGGTIAVPIGGGSVTGLACSTLYHFRATATNAGGTTSGADATFTTLACPPTVTTGAASSVGRNSATLNGTANPRGLATTAHYDYGLTTGYGGTTPVQAMGSGSVAVSIGGGAIAGLTCNTLYHFRAAAVSAGGTTLGADAAFTTRPCHSSGIDYDGDGMDDVAVFRPSTATWYARESGGGFLIQGWGLATDIPMPGDYDGDGRADPAVFRPSTGTWYILKSSSNYTTFMSQTWGLGTDIPVPGDYDDDGKNDFAVFRPSTGTWYVLLSSTNYTTFLSPSWGLGTDVPAPGDYDGDGKTDPAVFRPSTGTWYVLKSSTNFTTALIQTWGLGTDIAVPGDYDGDGKTDPAVFRPSTGTWYLLQSSTNYTTFVAQAWGLGTDTAVPADYDGDGRTDLCLFRSSTGTWYILTSSSGYTSFFTASWGQATDVAVLARP